MENMEHTTPRQPTRRRKKRKSWKRMVRAYLPLAVVVLLIILFIIFAVGSVNRANERREQERQESLAIESSIAQQQADWELEALQLVRESEKYAVSCHWDKAIAVLDQFSGNPSDFAVLMNARETYEQGDRNLVSWEDTKNIPFLSFGKLIMDPITGFSGTDGEDNRYLYISCPEFTAILQQLYDNGYMLVDMDDIFTTLTAEDGSSVILQNDLRLPAGKKPIVLIHAQTGGYDNKLVNVAGDIQSLVTPESGESYTGSYDFVPLLEDFIESHPGFSYKGARAILAITAGKNIFGYELNDVTTITECANNLKEKGYTLASGTYGNIAYGKVDIESLKDDIESWETNVEPLLGETEILAYAKSSDIDDGKGSYGSSNKKYQQLYNAGFKYYLGTCYNSSPWMDISNTTIRMGRIVVNGNYLKEKASMYAGLFDATRVYGTK